MISRRVLRSIALGLRTLHRQFPRRKGFTLMEVRAVSGAPLATLLSAGATYCDDLTALVKAPVTFQRKRFCVGS